jgi:hypothetical protein
MPITVKSPTGAEIIGTVETIPGVARIARFNRTDDGALEFEWAGDTEISWDDQVTVRRDGETLFEDADGATWKESELLISEPAEEEADAGDEEAASLTHPKGFDHA